MTLTVLFRWLALLCNMAVIGSIALLLQNAYNKGFGIEEGAIPLFVFVAALLIRTACIRISTELSHLASVNAKKSLRSQIYAKVLRLGLSYRNRLSSAAVVQMSVEGVEKLQVYISGYLPQLFYSMLAPLTLFAVFIFINLKVALALLACVPLIPLSILLIRKIAGRMMGRHWGQYTDLGKNFLESLQGLTTLKIYGADERRQKEMSRTSEGFRKTTMRVLRMQLGSVTFMDLIAYGGTALGIWTAVSETAAGSISLGACVFVLLLSSEFFLPLRMLGSFFHSSMTGIAAAQQIFSLLDSPEPREGTQEIEGLDIRLTDCTFAYEGARTALENLSLSLPLGSFTAVVGESGCGKSTLAKILAGELKSYGGSASIGGSELCDIKEESIVRHISLTEHNACIFKGTVAENLVFGAPYASEEEMMGALERVKLADFVAENGGLSMKIQERGANLSGGQKQRLAIARALLHHSDIYIFDEITSGVDPENEADIMDTLKALAGEKTVILITHRMKLSQTAQNILVLREGRGVEFGTHDELMCQNGWYAGLYNAQNSIENFEEREEEATPWRATVCV